MAILNDVGQKWVLDGMEETPEEMIDYMMENPAILLTAGFSFL